MIPNDIQGEQDGQNAHPTRPQPMATPQAYPQEYPQEYVEDVAEVRTPLGRVFTILIKEGFRRQPNAGRLERR